MVTAAHLSRLWLRTEEGQPQQDHPRDQGDCPPISSWGAQGAGQDRHAGRERSGPCGAAGKSWTGPTARRFQGTVDYGISEQLAELFRGNEGNTLGAEIARCTLPAPNGQQPTDENCWHEH
jgi:hypothetical protein